MLKKSLLINTDYYRWLISLVNGSDVPSNKQDMIFSILHTIPFTWQMVRDENRALAGRNLRELYLYLLGEANIRVKYGYMDIDMMNDIIDEELGEYGTCSVLETLIGIAKEWEDELAFDASFGDRTAHWFWDHIIYNLGLRDARLSQKRVREAIFYWMDREYDHDGNGNIFTIPNSDINMTNSEIWWQLCAYVNYLEESGTEYMGAQNIYF